MDTAPPRIPLSPYRIAVPDASLTDLRDRLAATRWPEPEPVDDWSQGTPLEWLKSVCRTWERDHDWRATEKRLNALPQLLASVTHPGHGEVLDIHVVHVVSPEPDARPLLMTHGWPGSIIEFEKVIGPLTDPVRHGGRAEDAFHLVLPTLPGYGFSGKPTRSGWGVESIAVVWDRLMRALGYDTYLAQGGDWGAAVTTAIGVLASRGAAGCSAVHFTLPLAGPDRTTLDSLTDDERIALDAARFYDEQDSGYSRIQSTRPQTVGYGLVDSPAALAGWILEKFHRWTDCNGDPESVISRDTLLDNLGMYWFTGAGASSARLYWESFAAARRDPVTIASACSLFPREIMRASRRWTERRYQSLVYWNQPGRGGHFAALEQPRLFVDEVRAGLSRSILATPRRQPNADGEAP